MSLTLVFFYDTTFHIGSSHKKGGDKTAFSYEMGQRQIWEGLLEDRGNILHA